MRRFVVATALLGCVRSPAPSAAGLEPECRVDADCVITDFSGCCSCCSCPGQEYAIPKVRLEASERMCTVVDCEPCPEPCPQCEPYLPPAASFAAVCDAGQCAAEPRER